MHIHVYFTPSGIVARETQPGDIFIVIDVIRATTTLAVVFERGAAHVFVAGSIEQARAAAHLHPGRLLCGERNVRPLPGFDYGNSPVQFSQLDLTGRELILTTTNGTRAFHACPTNTTRLAGSFYNAQAVTTHALQLAQERDSNIALICSGESITSHSTMPFALATSCKRYNNRPNPTSLICTFTRAHWQPLPSTMHTNHPGS